MRKFLNFIRMAITGYEPVATRAFVSAVFAALALGGIGSGQIPAKVEMLLALLIIVVPFVLSLWARYKVVPGLKVSLTKTGKNEYDVDLHPDEDDPDDDVPLLDEEPEADFQARMAAAEEPRPGGRRIATGFDS